MMSLETVTLSVIYALSVIYEECHNAECYDVCHYATSRGGPFPPI
jgi:hypothetical protein